MYEPTKFFANRGLERNKKPLRNIYYLIEISRLQGQDTMTEEELKKYEKYKFKDNGYLVLSWALNPHKDCSPLWNWHGFITKEEFIELLGQEQWSKLCQGKRMFIKQRRFDGRNIKKEKNVKA